MIELEPDSPAGRQEPPVEDAFSGWVEGPRNTQEVFIPSQTVVTGYQRFLVETPPTERRLYVSWLNGLSVEQISMETGIAETKVLESITRVADGWTRKSPPGNGQTGLLLVEPEIDPNGLRQPVSVELGAMRLVAETLKLFADPDYEPKDEREPQITAALSERGNIIDIAAEPSLLSGAIKVWFWHHPEISAAVDDEVDILAERPLEPFDNLPPEDPDIKL